MIRILLKLFKRRRLKRMVFLDRKKDADAMCSGSAFRWRRDRSASCIITLITTIVFAVMTYLLLKETANFLYDRAPGLQQIMQRQYCEEFIDKAIVDRLQLSARSPSNTAARTIIKGPYNPKEDRHTPFDESGINSVTALPDVHRVFYNRVAKCGSRSVMRILEKLEKLNNFTIYKSKVYDKMKLQLDAQAEFVDMINTLPKPLLIDRHMHFLDFEAMGAEQPAYFNVVRDPIDRAISTFYFKQNSTKKADNTVKTFDECVHQKKEGCTGRHVDMKMLYYFCGQDPRCWFDRNRSWTLARAKQNVRKHYAVVGLVEDMDSFFYALEKRLPRFFRGAFGLYGRYGAALKDAYKTENKINPSEEVRKIMKRNMAETYEFYYFVKQRFHNLLDHLMEMGS